MDGVNTRKKNKLQSQKSVKGKQSAATVCSCDHHVGAVQESLPLIGATIKKKKALSLQAPP